MNSPDKPLQVIIGTGALGLAVMRELTRRGETIRLVNRSGRRQPAWPADTMSADAADPQAIRQACQGASVIYHCAQPPYAQWPAKAPAIMQSLIGAAAETGAKLIYGDNLYMYGKAPMPLVETLPHAPLGPNTRTRALLADMLTAAHQAGKLRMAIARGSDFYGPHALRSTMGERVFPKVLQGRAAQVIGNPDIPHTYTFIDDFARALAILGERDEALGEVWHVPSGDTHTTRAFIEVVCQEAGHEPKLSALPLWLVRALGLVNPTMRAVAEVLYQLESPWILDSSKFVSTFGDISTPRREAIRQTLAWYRERQEGT